MTGCGVLRSDMVSERGVRINFRGEDQMAIMEYVEVLAYVLTLGLAVVTEYTEAIGLSSVDYTMEFNETRMECLGKIGLAVDMDYLETVGLVVREYLVKIERAAFIGMKFHLHLQDLRHWKMKRIGRR